MYIVSLNTQFRTIFVTRLNKLEMLVELTITNNLPKQLSTFNCEVWQGCPESNREALWQWFLSYLMALMYNQYSQVILSIPIITNYQLFCILKTVKPVWLIFVPFFVHHDLCLFFNILCFRIRMFLKVFNCFFANFFFIH